MAQAHHRDRNTFNGHADHTHNHYHGYNRQRYDWSAQRYDWQWQAWSAKTTSGHNYYAQKHNGQQDIRRNIDDSHNRNSSLALSRKTNLVIDVTHKDDLHHHQDLVKRQPSLSSPSVTSPSLSLSHSSQMTSPTNSTTTTSSLAESITAQDFTKEKWKQINEHREYMKLRFETLKKLRQAAEEELAGDREQEILTRFQEDKEMKKRVGGKRVRDDQITGEEKERSLIKRPCSNINDKDACSLILPRFTAVPTTPPRPTA